MLFFSGAGTPWMLLALAATTAAVVPYHTWDAVVSAERQHLAAIPDTLDLKLLKEMTTNLSRNEAISPFVMNSLMTQLWLGATGITRDELTPVLGLTGLAPEEFLPAHQSAIEEFSSGTSNVTTAVYNGIYVRGGFSVKQSFSDLLNTHFHAVVQTYTYPDVAAEKINTDVANVTRDRIKDLVSADVLEDAALVLVSALYFKGDWLLPFDPSATRKSDFLTAEGDQQVDMMSLWRETLPYMTTDTFDAVSLAYSDPAYCMLLVRPKSRDMAAVTALRDSLDSLNVNDIMEQLTDSLVTVRMPRFKIETSYSMKNAFTALNVSHMFYPGAKFGGISERPLYVSEIIHKVFIEVTEEGTEAAGAGAAVMVPYSMGPRPKYFILDRPFFAFVYNKQKHINMFSTYVALPPSDTASPGY